MGITTFYKLDPDGSLWIKMLGTMDDVGIMDQLATVREVDLFDTWVPFCNSSRLLKRLGIVELIAYFSVSLPGIGRWVPCCTYPSASKVDSLLSYDGDKMSKKRKFLQTDILSECLTHVYGALVVTVLQGVFQLKQREMTLFAEDHLPCHYPDPDNNDLAPGGLLFRPLFPVTVYFMPTGATR